MPFSAHCQLSASAAKDQMPISGRFRGVGFDGEDDIYKELRQELGAFVEAATASRTTHGFSTNRRNATVSTVRGFIRGMSI
jgi:hypothetical protein